jgi:hypothetical protein
MSIDVTGPIHAGSTRSTGQPVTRELVERFLTLPAYERMP